MTQLVQCVIMMDFMTANFISYTTYISYLKDMVIAFYELQSAAITDMWYNYIIGALKNWEQESLE